MYHRWSLTEIVSAILHGLAQRILDLIPLIDPWAEPDWPPSWWLFWGNITSWRQHRNGRGIPDSWLIEEYLRLVWRTLGYWVEEVGSWARDVAKDAVRGWIGYVKYGWNNFSTWIDTLGIRLGSGMVFWAGSVIDALTKAYNWIPPEIRSNLQSWGSLLNYWIQKGKDWVIATYHAWIALGLLAWTWVSDSGTRLKEWWQSARGVLDDFRSNPTGYILAHLGPIWGRLVWFVNNALDFYTGLWGQYSHDLAGFLADPAGWIWARLEAYVLRLW